MARNERRRLPPAAREHELVQGAAGPMLVALAQFFRRARLVTRVSQGDGRRGFVRVWNTIQVPRLTRVEARHAMGEYAQCRGLQHQESGSDSGIVPGMPVGLAARVELELRSRRWMLRVPPPSS